LPTTLGVNSIGGNPFNVLNHTNVVSLNQFYGVASSPIPVFATANKAAIPRQLQFSVDFEF
jgi:hypothetical protein